MVTNEHAVAACAALLDAIPDENMPELLAALGDLVLAEFVSQSMRHPEQLTRIVPNSPWSAFVAGGLAALDAVKACGGLTTDEAGNPQLAGAEEWLDLAVAMDLMSSGAERVGVSQWPKYDIRVG